MEEGGGGRGGTAMRTGNVSVCARRGVEMGEEGQVQLEGSGHKEKKGGG